MFQTSRPETSASSPMFNPWNNLDSFDPDQSKMDQDLYLEEEEDMPIIPDIDDLRDQDFIQQPADAPSIEINQIGNLDELENKVRKLPFLETSTKVDMSLLANVCLPEDKVRENDVPWTWDSLITDVMYHADVVSLINSEQSDNVKLPNSGSIAKDTKNNIV